MTDERTSAQRSPRWDHALFVIFKTAPHPLLRVVRRAMPSAPIEEIVVIGRQTGRERRHLVSLIERDGRLYVGHPNGRSHWVQNLEAHPDAVLRRRRVPPAAVRAVPLPDGEERDSVIERAGKMPFPAGSLYRAASPHIRAVGAYFRLEPADGGGESGNS